MYRNIGIIEISRHTDNWKDLINILLINGYALEIEMNEPIPFYSEDECGSLQIMIKEKLSDNEINNKN